MPKTARIAVVLAAAMMLTACASEPSAEETPAETPTLNDTDGSESPAATGPAEPAVALEGSWSCEGDSSQVLLDGAPTESDGYEDFTLTSVDLTIDGDGATVTWEVVGEIPARAVSDGGADKTWAAYVMFDVGGDLYDLKAHLIGSEWHVNGGPFVGDRVEGASPPLIAGPTITATFPSNALPDSASGWRGLIEADGDTDPDFPDFELFYVMQDTCPFSEDAVGTGEMQSLD